MKRIVVASVFAASIAAKALAGPDEVTLGKHEGYPIAGIGNSKNWYFDESVRVGSFTHQAEIPRLLNGKVNMLKASERPLKLGRAPVQPDYRWHIEGERNLTVDDFLGRQRIMGLLIIKDGAIQVERYQYDRKPTHRSHRTR